MVPILSPVLWKKGFKDFNQHAGSWTMSSTHGSSLVFPSGLCDKVLTDRIRYLAATSCQAGGRTCGNFLNAFCTRPRREMSEPWLPEKDFANKYMIVPAMPRTGGAARLASLLQGRSMLLGTDSFPIRHPPQYWRDLRRDLQPIIKKEASKARVPAVQMQHWTMENAACCFTKVIDHLLGLQSHALYKWLFEWKHKEFEPGNLPQCPTKVSIQQSLHRRTIVS